MKEIRLDNITHAYGTHVVLKQLQLTIPTQKMVAICGPSGCGKTTLLNIIGLLERPTQGTVTFDEECIKANTRLAQKHLRYTIGFLFQNYGLSDNDTVMWNMLSAMEYVNLGKAKKKERIHQALERVSLSGVEEQKVCQLSGGEQQRVALARLMVKPCELILADEPTGNLDENNRDIVFSLLEEMKQEGKTILIVTHDTALAQRCDEVITLTK